MPNVGFDVDFFAMLIGIIVELKKLGKVRRGTFYAIRLWFTNNAK